MYVATGEVTALKHELRDNAVEGRTSVAEALLAGAESAEVLSGLWDYIVVEVEVDTASVRYIESLSARDLVERWSGPARVRRICERAVKYYLVG